MIYVLIAVFNILLIVISLATGAGQISFTELFSFLGNSLDNESIRYIFSDLRVPRTFALVSIGLSLGYSGIILQTILDNPLSEPYTLGLSGGATLGAVIALLIGIQPVWLSLPAGSIIGCVIITIFVLGFSQKKYLWKSNSMILVGVMISLFCGAFVTLIISLLEPSKMQLAIFWMMGQVGSPRDLWWIYLFLLFTAALIYGLWNKVHLDRFLIGEDLAVNLGTNTKKIRTRFIILVCLLTSISVSIAGLVGFVGLVAPHITYAILKTKRHGKTLVVAPLVGSALFLISDILSRLMSRDIEIPAGSLMALIGAPILIYFLINGFKNKAVKNA
ncbi:MAG: iron ABC transporter permease [Bdellovibrionota bacterium]